MADEKKIDEAKMEVKDQEQLFRGFISLISGITMQQLGKVANPITGEIERNLDVAKAWIETLRMIREKTKGNLNDSENRFLESTISGLQMNYADEVAKGPEKPEEKEEVPAAEKSEEAPTEEKGKEEDNKQDEIRDKGKQ